MTITFFELAAIVETKSLNKVTVDGSLPFLNCSAATIFIIRFSFLSIGNTAKKNADRYSVFTFAVLSELQKQLLENDFIVNEIHFLNQKFH